MPDETAPVLLESIVAMIPLVAMLLACALAAVVGARARCEVRRCDRLVWDDPSALVGFGESNRLDVQVGGVVGAIVSALLVLYLAWPVVLGAGGHRLAAFEVGVAGLVSSIALFGLVHGRFVTGVADVAQALLALGMCGFLLVLAPASSDLAHRMPGHLCVLAFAGAVMAGFWCWLLGVWGQQLDNGKAWTTAGRLWEQLPRYAFGAASFGVLAAAVMTLWPRLPGIAHRDATFGRMATGVAAHLFLLLVASVCGRRLKRESFFGLAAIATVSLAAFVILRAADFVTIVRQ